MTPWTDMELEKVLWAAFELLSGLCEIVVLVFRKWFVKNCADPSCWKTPHHFVSAPAPVPSEAILSFEFESKLACSRIYFPRSHLQSRKKNKLEKSRKIAMQSQAARQHQQCSLMKNKDATSNTKIFPSQNLPPRPSATKYSNQKSELKTKNVIQRSSSFPSLCRTLHPHLPMHYARDW